MTEQSLTVCCRAPVHGYFLHGGMPPVRCGGRGRSGEDGLTKRDDEEQLTAFHRVNGVALDVLRAEHSPRDAVSQRILRP